MEDTDIIIIDPVDVATIKADLSQVLLDVYESEVDEPNCTQVSPFKDELIDRAAARVSMTPITIKDSDETISDED